MMLLLKCLISVKFGWSGSQPFVGHHQLPTLHKLDNNIRNTSSWCVNSCWAPSNELTFGTTELKAEEVSVLVSVSISHTDCAAQQQLLNPKNPVPSSSLKWVNHQTSQVSKYLVEHRLSSSYSHASGTAVHFHFDYQCLSSISNFSLFAIPRDLKWKEGYIFKWQHQFSLHW